MTNIRLRPNGPYVIEGDDVHVTDSNGVEFHTDRLPIALCRCGASANKPFCDGSHVRIGFRGSEGSDERHAADDKAKP